MHVKLKHVLVLSAALLASACGEAPSQSVETASDTMVENTGSVTTGQTETGKDDQRLLPAGAWRGVIEIQGQKLPFQMEVIYPSSLSTPDIVFINGEERVEVEEVHVSEDRVAMVLPAFNTRIDARYRDNKLSGTLIKINEGAIEQKMPVTMTPGEQYRFFPVLKPAAVDLSGRWSVEFHEPDGSNYPAVGEFRQVGSQVFGTFLTPASDYRYLAGAVRDGRLYLSAWDGYHVFLFEAEILDDGTLKGDFWSGPSYHESWVAHRDPDAKLPDMDKQTRLREDAGPFDFSFPNLEGEMVSLSDPRFDGKVVVVQLAGSWCPNCADETRFLAPWYKENRDRGVEVVALMFEHYGDFDKAAKQVRIWREKYGVEYPTLVAGTSDKDNASSKLPQLNAFLAFPTTIFVGRDGEVARIHTGFNGPATDRYEEGITEFNATVDALLQARP